MLKPLRIKMQIKIKKMNNNLMSFNIDDNSLL